VSSAHKRKTRSRVEFARQVIRIPEGRHEGELWRKDFQPWAYWLLHLMDTLGYRRFAITGCVQSGKTLVTVVFNVLWHLFERNESVIFIVPELSMAEKKWTDEIAPVINKSRWLRNIAYGDPNRTSVLRGRGSKSGFTSTLRFANGTRLEFMSGSGNDARRSSSTAPVIFKTEVDRIDKPTASSREASAAQTIEDRAEAYGDDSYIYEECTMTTVDGRINKQLHAGTYHTMYGKCPHCEVYVRPLREHFVGVEDCESPLEARESASFCCPACACLIDEYERRKMQDGSIPMARGQEIKTGTDGAALIEGDLPSTEVMSFWWNAFDNRFLTTSRIASKEWTALYSEDTEDEDKQARQKRWTEPSIATQLDVSSLSMQTLIGKTADTQRTVVPDGTLWVSAGADYRETQVHYVVRAWTHENNMLVGHAIDIGWLNVDRDKLGPHDATLDALRRLINDRLFSGMYRDSTGKQFVPGWTLIDGRYKEAWIWEFVRECVRAGKVTIIPVLGRGQSDPNTPGTYRHPVKIDTDGPNKKVYWIGDQCHLRKSSQHAEVFAEVGSALPPMYMSINTDEGKSFLRDGFNAPIGTNGTLTTFRPVTSDERAVLADYRKQMRAEKEIWTHVDGKGLVRKFVNEGRAHNHYFDADNYCCFGVQLCGAPVSVVRKNKPMVTSKPTDSNLTMPDGRAFMAVQ